MRFLDQLPKAFFEFQLLYVQHIGDDCAYVKTRDIIELLNENVVI